MFKFGFRHINFIVIAVISLIVQCTWINLIAVFSIKPDLILLLVVFFGLYNDTRLSIFCGIMLGLGVDVLSSGIIGLNCFTMGCAGGFVALIKEKIYGDNIITKIILPFFACVFQVVTYHILAANFYRLPNPFENMPAIAGAVVYTTLFNLIFLKLLQKYILVRYPVLS